MRTIDDDKRRQEIYGRLHLKMANGTPHDTNEMHLVSWIIKLQDAVDELINESQSHMFDIDRCLDRKDPDYGLID